MNLEAFSRNQCFNPYRFKMLRTCNTRKYEILYFLTFIIVLAWNFYANYTKNKLIYPPAKFVNIETQNSRGIQSKITQSNFRTNLQSTLTTLETRGMINTTQTSITEHSLDSNEKMVNHSYNLTTTQISLKNNQQDYQKRVSNLLNVFESKYSRIYKQFIVLVMSGRQNFAQRKAIRESYGSVSGFQNYFFMIGIQWDPKRNGRMLNSTEQEEEHQTNLQLQEESLRYNDLVLHDFQDTYNNLTLKVINSLIWGIDTFPNSTYFVKVDDDTLFIPSQASKIIKYSEIRYRPSRFTSKISESVSEPILYMGKMGNYKLTLEPDSKWYDAEFIQDYPGRNIYPKYANGCGGYLLHRKIIEYFKFRYQQGQIDQAIQQENSVQKQGLKLYHNEDSSIGTWIWQGLIQNKNASESNFVRSIRYYDFGFTCDWDGVESVCDFKRRGRNAITYGHKLSPKDLFICWNRYLNKWKKKELLGE